MKKWEEERLPGLDYLPVHYIGELNREIKMRERVWKKVPGTKNRFLNPEHQKSYDILKELHGLLSVLGGPTLYDMRIKASSVMALVQQSAFGEKDI